MEETIIYTVTFQLSSPDMQFLELPQRLARYYPTIEVLQHTNTTLVCKVPAVDFSLLTAHLLNVIEPDEDRSGFYCGYMEQEREQFYSKVASITITNPDDVVHRLYQEDYVYRNAHYLVKVFFNDTWDARCQPYKWRPLRCLQEEIDNIYTDPDNYFPLFPIYPIVSERECCVFHTETDCVREKDKVAFIRDSIQEAARAQKCPNGIDQIVIKRVEKLYTSLTFHQDCSEEDKKIAHEWLEAHTCGAKGKGYIELYEGDSPYFTKNPPVTLAQTRQAREEVIKAWVIRHLPMVKEMQVMLYI